MFKFVRDDKQLIHLKVWAKDRIKFKCFINCTLRELTFYHAVCCMLHIRAVE